MRIRRLPFLIMLVICVAAGRNSVAAPSANGAVIDAPNGLNFLLRDVTAKAPATISPAQFKGGKGVILFFVSSTCPVTGRYADRVNALRKRFEKDFAWIGVKSNARESENDITAFCAASRFDLPVVLDEDNAISSYYGVAVTPAFVLLDHAGVVRYIGAFDDNVNAQAVKKTFLPDAAWAVLAGKPVAVKKTPIFGCAFPAMTR